MLSQLWFDGGFIQVGEFFRVRLVLKTSLYKRWPRIEESSPAALRFHARFQREESYELRGV